MEHNSETSSSAEPDVWSAERARRTRQRGRKRSRRAAGAAVALATALTAAACSSSGAAPSAQSGPITLTFWVKSPFPDSSTLLNLWNKEHPDIHIKLDVVATSGNTIPQAQLLLDVKAHTTPDVAIFDYEYLPQFVDTGAIQDLSAIPGGNATSLSSDFESWAWDTVHVGNGLYGLPIDAGPLSLYYRKDLFAKYNLPVPTTMAEYTADALKLHQEDPSVAFADFPTNDASPFTALAWANGATPFQVKGNSWYVNIASPQALTVASQLQQLIDAKAILTLPQFSSQWSADFNNGTIASWISAAWAPGPLESMAPKTAGDWAVATLPQWTAGVASNGDWGGSNAVVFKATNYPQQALQFAEFLTTNQQAWSQYWMPKISDYPANKQALSDPSLSTASSFFGGQKIYDTIAKSNEQVAHNFSFGPVANEWFTTEENYLQDAVNGQMTIAQALQQTQTTVVAYMKQQGLSVETP